MKAFRQKFLRFFRKDLFRKGVALLMAVSIYFAYADQLQDVRSGVKVPVEISVEPGLILMNHIEKLQVLVKVKGSSKKLEQHPLDNYGITGHVTITRNDLGSDGRYRINITPDCFESSNGIRVVDVDPHSKVQYFNAQLERSKNVKVQPVFEGNLSPDFSLAATQCVPAEIRITGPEGSVNAIQEIHTLKIALKESLTESFEQSVALNIPENMQADPEQVLVQCEIARNKSVRSFKSLPVLVAGKSGSGELAVELEPAQSSVDVTLYGEVSRIMNLKSDDINVYVDITNITEPGVYTLPVICNVKNLATVTVRAVMPGEIKVKVVKR